MLFSLLILLCWVFLMVMGWVGLMWWKKVILCLRKLCIVFIDLFLVKKGLLLVF